MTIHIREQLEEALAPVGAAWYDDADARDEHLGALVENNNDLIFRTRDRGDVYVDSARIYAAAARGDERIQRLMREIELEAIADHRQGVIDTTLGQVMRQQYLADPAPVVFSPNSLAEAYYHTGNAVVEAELAAVRAKVQLRYNISTAVTEALESRATLSKHPPAKRETLIRPRHADALRHQRAEELRFEGRTEPATVQTQRVAITSPTRRAVFWRGIDDELADRAEALANRMLAQPNSPSLGPIRQQIAAITAPNGFRLIADQQRIVARLQSALNGPVARTVRPADARAPSTDAPSPSSSPPTPTHDSNLSVSR